MGYMQGLLYLFIRISDRSPLCPAFPWKRRGKENSAENGTAAIKASHSQYLMLAACFIPLQACLFSLFSNLQSFLVHSPLSLSGLVEFVVDWIVILLANPFRFMWIFGLIIAFFFLKMILVRWVKAQIHCPIRSYAVASSGKLQPPKK